MHQIWVFLYQYFSAGSKNNSYSGQITYSDVYFEPCLNGGHRLQYKSPGKIRSWRICKTSGHFSLKKTTKCQDKISIYLPKKDCQTHLLVFLYLVCMFSLYLLNLSFSLCYNMHYTVFNWWLKQTHCLLIYNCHF